MSGMVLRKFVAPEIIFGRGSRALAGRYARNLGGTKILVVTDDGVAEAGWLDPLLESLEGEGLGWAVYRDVQPNPTESMVMRGAHIYTSEGCDLILTLGGGSPMDCAKAIGAVHANGGNVLDFVGVDKIPVPCPPVVCIPTTAGSAADISQFSIIKNEKTGIKHAIVSKSMVPDVALVDPDTTLTMDGFLTASTGMDALTHAFEAYVSRAHSPLTDLHALQSVEMVHTFLLRAMGDLSNPEYRTGMMLASLHAGLAFSNASLGVVHALSHSLGGLLDLPHGECNSLLLRHGVEANFDAVPERFASLLERFGGPAEPPGVLPGLLARLDDLRERAGLPGRLRDLGLSEDLLPEIAAAAWEDPCMITNPRPMSSSDLEGILRNAY
ncbi:alcohol dehydrogenase class IV [Aminivibrio pyruvatiphilus]|uniref:Alcohol dehydrogenase class IV n=2 Tax=Aminivibrio pyruvatiphilus TaxID=1005740 RepID=A0A4R8MG43_9BACT|nr:alcohol dehydrogenase class IV [Aminivibrio pyruvatiphilus]